MSEYVRVPREPTMAILNALGYDPQINSLEEMSEWWADLLEVAATPEAQVAPQGGGELVEGTLELGELTPDRIEFIAGAVAAAWTKNWRECARRGRLAAAALRELNKPQPAGTLSGDVEQVAREGVPFGIIDPDYARIYTQARVLAWSEGYALTLHGSFTRDLDLLAVPWTDRACEPEHLVRRLAEVAELRVRDDDPGTMPHGRLAWTLRLPGFGEPRWIDFGVMPRDAALRTQAHDPLGAVDVELATLLFNAGYSDGHHYTVDGGYVDVAREDRMTHHREDVEDLIAEYRAALSAKETANGG